MQNIVVFASALLRRYPVDLKRFRKWHAGFTLAETIFTAAIALAGIGAALALNTAHLRLVKSSRDSNAATLSLQERVEQMRLANWRKMTDATYLQDVLLKTQPASAAPLEGVSERVTISAYPDPLVAQRLIVERDASGQRRTISAGSGLLGQRLAQVELRVVWNGNDGRQRVRATTTVISNGGISRMNLPGIGTPGGAPSGEPTPIPTPIPTPEPGGGTSATPTPAPTPTPTPTPAPTNNGNGNGRGNVGGKPGKN